MVQRIDDGGMVSNAGGGLKAPTMTPAQKASVASYAGPTPQTSISSFSSGGPAPYIAPVQNYAGPQSNPYNTGPIGRPAEAPAPPPPPVPPVGGRQAYDAMDAGGRAAQDASWLGGDSDYTAQISEYDRALQTFIDRIAGQKKMFETDANDATASTNRNQQMSTNDLGEDFGARGLSYSGLAIDSQDKTNSRFNEAKGQIGKVRARNDSDADMRLGDYRTENTISRGNAERSSLNRQAQRQALLDSQAGF